MPKRALRRCTAPGCGNTSDSAKGRGLCLACRRRRPTAAAEGYGRDWAQRIRLPFLTANPACVLCGRLAQHADHWPQSRRQLVAKRCPDPDAWHRLRPLCASCHGKETWKHQPPAWALR